ncbi:hypothetical protein PTE30175_01293 [Pandoraea terrae]|uniref:Uncharacterized protein n=1 Tax=Pandoraea terrae TaxID=1537710 RepID=A0A5E4TC33_9BURK|nr:hypothetical protein [Pandoraea terrae]VVD85746.1 hypothetical protein PTE30175_01293 [Pandoraea terrae]
MSDVERPIPTIDEAIAQCHREQDERAVELRKVTGKIAALAMAGGQGGTDSLDDEYVHAFFEQLEELASHAHELSAQIFDQRNNVFYRPTRAAA